MYQIDADGSVPSLPAPAALGTEGFWSKGNPLLGQSATVEDQDWFNAVQENLITFLTASGLAHSKTDYARLWQAMFAAFTFPDTGSADNVVVALPAGLAFPSGSIVAGTTVTVKAAATNATTTPAMTFMGHGPTAITRPDGSAPLVGDIIGGQYTTLVYDGTYWRQRSLPRLAPGLTGQQPYTAVGSYTFTMPPGVSVVHAELTGGGGGAGGCSNGGSVSSGGGGAERRRGWVRAAPGTPITVNVGGGGPGGSNAGTGGANGTASSIVVGGVTIIQANPGLASAGAVGVINNSYGLGGSAGTGGYDSDPGSSGGQPTSLGAIVFNGLGGGAFGTGPALFGLGTNGTQPGQGGSGYSGAGGGGNGKDGKVLLTW